MEKLHDGIVIRGVFRRWGPFGVDLDANLDLEMPTNHTYNIRVFRIQTNFDLEFKLLAIKEHFRRETFFEMV
jgi:hypothetical protein